MSLFTVAAVAADPQTAPDLPWPVESLVFILVLVLVVYAMLRVLLRK